MRALCYSGRVYAHVVLLLLQHRDNHRRERALRIAREFSDIIVYCRPVPFHIENGTQAMNLSVAQSPLYFNSTCNYKSCRYLQ